MGVVVTDMDLTKLGCNVSISDNAVTGCCRYVDVVVATHGQHRAGLYCICIRQCCD